MGHENVVDVECMMSLNICGGVLDAIIGRPVLGCGRAEAGFGRAYDMFASLLGPSNESGQGTGRVGGVDAAMGGSLFGSVVLQNLLRVKHGPNSPTPLHSPVSV